MAWKIPPLTATSSCPFWPGDIVSYSRVRNLDGITFTRIVLLLKEGYYLEGYWNWNPEAYLDLTTRNPLWTETFWVNVSSKQTPHSYKYYTILAGPSLTNPRNNEDF